MSHVVDTGAEILDIDCARAAAAAIGMELVEASSFNYFAGRRHPCDYALRVKGNPNAREAGLVKRSGGQPGWTVRYDPDYGRGLVAVIGRDAKRLIKEYSLQVSAKSMAAQGYKIARKVVGNKTQLVCVR